MKFRHSFIAAALGLLFSSVVFAKAPNVVFICVDDMNGYGLLKEYAPLKMPYFDKLRERSVVFTNSYCNAPVCMPSRASFLSGKFPHNTGLYSNGKAAWPESKALKQVEFIPEFFKRSGYETWGRGKIFHGPIPVVREEAMFNNRPIYKGGFGPMPRKENQMGAPFWGVDSFPDEEFPDVINADAAVEFLSEQHEKPFFLYYGLWRPHTPFTAPPRFFEMYDINDITLPDGYNPTDLNDLSESGKQMAKSSRFSSAGASTPNEWKKMIRGYCATNSFADWNVGRVIEALDKSANGENTIVIIFSDNGYHCGEKDHWEKSTLWNMSAYVPMLIRTPETTGSVCSSTVSLVDLYPTLADYCGLGQPRSKLDGVSLVPFIKDPAKKVERAVLTTTGEKYSGVTDGRYRYIQYRDGSEELYDREDDPHEWNNVASNPNLRSVIERLKLEIPTKWHPTVKAKKKK